MWAGFPRPQNVVEVRDPRHPICHLSAGGQVFQTGSLRAARDGAGTRERTKVGVKPKDNSACPSTSKFTLMQSKGVLEPSMVGAG